MTHESNKEKINISREIRIEDLKKIHIRGRYQKNKDGFYSIENNEIKDEEVATILDILNKNYPNTVTIAKLEEKVKKLRMNETNNIFANIGYLIYSKLVEVYSRKLKIKKEKKLKITPKYRNYLNYFISTKNPVIVLSGYEGRISYDVINPIIIFIMDLFDGTRTDEEVLNILIEKEKTGELIVDAVEGLSKEEIIKSNIEICRDFIEINFFNK